MLLEDQKKNWWTRDLNPDHWVQPPGPQPTRYRSSRFSQTFLTYIPTKGGKNESLSNLLFILHHYTRHKQPQNKTHI